MTSLIPFVKPRYKQYWSIATLFILPFATIGVWYWLYTSPLTKKYMNHRYGRGVLFLYLFWLIFIDHDTPRKGGRPQPWMRNHRFWKHFRAYFPHSVIHQSGAPPDPSRKYIIGVHPHGIISIAGWCTLMSNNKNAFPGLDFRIITLPVNFRIPIWRDYLLGMNLADSSRESLQYMLSHNISVAIVIGGASESLDARPGTADLTLGRRLGFVRLAIENGADLIPLFSFGENDVYVPVIDNPKGSTMRTVQEKFKSIFGFTLPMIMGRRSNPIMPRRRPVVTVIGQAIPVGQKAHPTLKDILHVHQQYITALQGIWDEYKDVLAPDRRGEMTITDQLSESDFAKLAKLDAKNKRINAKL